MILPPPSGQPVHVPNYHVGYLFRTEMSSTVYPRGCGWERDGSMCAVRASLLFMHVPTYVGVCERDTNLDIMRRPSPCLRPVRPPVTSTPHSSSPYLSSFSLHFYIQGATIKITICRYTRPLTLIDAILMVLPRGTSKGGH